MWCPMTRHFGKRFVVLAAAIAGMLLFGNVAAAQPEPSDIAAQAGGVEVVEIVLGHAVKAGPGTEECQDPPCGPEPEPDEWGVCTLTVKKPVRAGATVSATANTDCNDGAGDPLYMTMIEMDLKLFEGPIMEDHKNDARGNAAAMNLDVASAMSECASWRARGEVWLDWPNGWIGERGGHKFSASVGPWCP
jgi:hypothetical protein